MKISDGFGESPPPLYLFKNWIKCITSVVLMLLVKYKLFDLQKDNKTSIIT